MLRSIVLLNFIFLLGSIAAKAEKSNTTDEKISIGQEINKEKAPYIVTVSEEHIISNRAVIVFRCEGSFVGRRHILTSANCVWEFKQGCRKLWVDFPKTAIDSSIMGISVWKITLHPKYSRLRSLEYDVALLELSDGVVFSERIRPIPVAEKEPSPGEIVQLSGWGKLLPNSCPAVNLRTVKISVIDRQSCQEMMPSDLRFEVTSKLFCSNLAKRRTCGGQIGGPVTLNDTLVGIVSWGNEFCTEPGLFTNLADPEIRFFIRKIAGV